MVRFWSGVCSEKKCGEVKVCEGIIIEIERSTLENLGVEINLEICVRPPQKKFHKMKVMCAGWHGHASGTTPDSVVGSSRQCSSIGGKGAAEKIGASYLQEHTHVY